MQIDLVPIILALIVLVATIAVTFYLKDFLQKRNEYKKLRRKLERVAGKQAKILYTGPGVFGGAQLFTIDDIDEHGITISNDLHTVFIPVAKLLQSEMVLPVGNWEKARIVKMKRDMEEFADALLPTMFEKLLPAMMEAVQKYVLTDIEEEGEVSFAIGMKIATFLKKEGIVKEIPEDLRQEVAKRKRLTAQQKDAPAKE